MGIGITLRRLFLLIGLTAAANVNAQKMFNVTYLPPASSDNAFWNLSAAFAQAVADDLGINLTITYTSANTNVVKRQGNKILTGKKPPDYLLTAYLADITPEHLELAHDLNVRFVLINTNIPEDDRAKIGLPRERYKNWIAHMSPDDTAAGFDLANALINQAKTAGLTTKTGKTGIIALTGASNTNVAYDRSYGLQNRVNALEDAVLHKIRFSDWQRESAKLDTQELLQEYPGVNAIWAASDDMAFGAIDALAKSNRIAGKNILVGGIDWSFDGVKAVADGRFAATVGGHFMEAGWALILIHDYHQGIDFRNDPGVDFMTSMSVLDQTKAKEYLKKFGDGNWSAIDFKKFSKLYNPKLTFYNFSIDSLIKSN